MENERGFTLIELLVVIAIIAALFGVTALALGGVGDGAEDAAKAAEKDVVQTALDVCDAISSCSISAQGSAATIGPATPGFGAYIRRSSRYSYTWDGSGQILTQE